MKKLIATIALLSCLTAYAAEFGTINGTVGTFTALTNDGSPVLTEATATGGIPQWLTNYQFEATYNSNYWISQSSDVTNVLQFETETYDLGNIYNPTTFTATVIKDGRYETRVHWGMGHALSASQQMHTFFQTNGFAVGASFYLQGSQGNSQDVRDQIYERVLKLTSNSTVRACNLFTSSGTRLGGGDSSSANELRHHMSAFSMNYLGP